MTKRWIAGLLLLLGIVAPLVNAAAQGHGPVYALSTPTLRRGGWTLDVGVMGQAMDGHEMAMVRPMVSYGVTEDVQISASAPVRLRTSAGMMPARIATRMPGTSDLELGVGWRFQKRELGVGSRFESTAFAMVEYPTEATRMGLQTSPGLAGAVVTGYASRSGYAWIGGLYRRYVATGDAPDRPGDLTMYSAVVGYRPPAFQREYPHADWRLFVELIGEITARDVAQGSPRPASGGHRVFVGPTVLGLFGAWGVSGGPLFPVYQGLNGVQPRDRVRLAIDLIFWWF